ncbi:MAG: sigma-70 factor domain-containing protein, partial [Pirellulaceae bacterium]|nr:sigma-70 factor domain-containing protein [Pirellulaceae bacterium]
MISSYNFEGRSALGSIPEVNPTVADHRLPSRLVPSRDDANKTDDPIQLYLGQIGQYPLLSRMDEIAVASRIEVSRHQFRKMLLSCDWVLRQAVDLLKQVSGGSLPFDRTVQVAVSDRLEKHHIQGRLPQNLQTIQALIRQNDLDYAIATSRSHTMDQRRRAWRQLVRRRCRVIRLIEELGLRMSFLEACYTEIVDQAS